MGERMKSLLLFSAVAGASLVTGLGAQVTPPKADSSCTKYSDGRVECRMYRRGPGDSTLRNLTFYRTDSALAKRAALGLELRTTGTKRDTLGVFVEAVTPKGPAETAGIVEGDRIAAINGVDLRTTGADTEDSYTNGLASHRLTREVQKLMPGTRVTLRIYSGGRFRDVQVTTGKASDVMRLGNRFDFRMPGMGEMEFDGPGMMRFAPQMQLMRSRMPMIRQQIEPLLRERIRDLPNQTQFRSFPRIKTAAPIRVRTPQNYKVERGGEDLRSGDGDMPDMEEPLLLEFDDEPFEFDNDFEPFEFENEIETVSPAVIRGLAATTIRDAGVALKQLAAAGIA